MFLCYKEQAYAELEKGTPVPKVKEMVVQMKAAVIASLAAAAEKDEEHEKDATELEKDAQELCEEEVPDDDPEVEDVN